MTTLPAWVRDSLRCPACREPLSDTREGDHLEALTCTSPACGLRYPVQGGIPVLLVSDASPTTGPTFAPDAPAAPATPGPPDAPAAR